MTKMGVDGCMHVAHVGVLRSGCSKEAQNATAVIVLLCGNGVIGKVEVVLGDLLCTSAISPLFAAKRVALAHQGNQKKEQKNILVVGHTCFSPAPAGR